MPQITSNEIIIKKENKEEKKRTLQQNRALHLYFKLVAEELNRAGLDMKVVLKPEVDIPWSTQSVKEFLWRPVQKAYLGKRSTTELTTTDIDKIYDVLNLHLSERLGEFQKFIPFPSLENLISQLENSGPLKI